MKTQFVINDFKLEEPWRLFKIMGEFVDGIESLHDLGPAVSICGSARVPPDDPVYGVRGEDSKLLNIGGIELRGETGVLAIPATLLTRLRHNPFYSYQADRVREFADQIVKTHSPP